MPPTPQAAERTHSARRFARRFALLTHGVLAAVIVVLPAAATALAGAILIALLAGATYTDLRWRRIPNWLTYPALAWTLLLAAGLAPLSPASLLPNASATVGLGLSDALFGGAVCFAGVLLLYRLAGTGGGDVKLAAAIGALVGVQAGVSTILWCHLLAAGGMLAWRALTTDPRGLANRVALFVAAPLPFPQWQPTGAERAPTEVPLAAYFTGGVVLTLSGASLV